MTCQECELKLGMGEEVGEHLALCSECRGLAEELRLNAVALREMRVRPRMHWVMAVAAAILVAVGVWRMTRVEGLVVQPVRIVAVAERPQLAGHGPAPHVKNRAKRAGREPAPLRVKMFTSDPDVVIYWIVDQKEGIE